MRAHFSPKPRIITPRFTHGMRECMPAGQHRGRVACALRRKVLRPVRGHAPDLLWHRLPLRCTEPSRTPTPRGCLAADEWERAWYMHEARVIHTCNASPWLATLVPSQRGINSSSTVLTSRFRVERLSCSRLVFRPSHRYDSSRLIAQCPTAVIPSTRPRSGPARPPCSDRTS